MPRSSPEVFRHLDSHDSQGDAEIDPFAEARPQPGSIEAIGLGDKEALSETAEAE